MPTFASYNSNSPLYYIAVTLTNNQSSATPTSFVQKVKINSSTNSSKYASNLSNVNWQDGNGNILKSWLESGETNSSTSSVYRVRLTSTIAGSGGTLTIYQVIYGTSINVFDGNNTGAEPNFDGTYGHYDNGTNVWTFYDNFTGTTLSSSLWDTANIQMYQETYAVSNGLTLTGTGDGYYGDICSLNTYSTPLVIEALQLNFTLYQTTSTGGNISFVGMSSTNTPGGTGAPAYKGGYLTTEDCDPHGQSGWNGNIKVAIGYYTTGGSWGAFDTYQTGISESSFFATPQIISISWYATGSLYSSLGSYSDNSTDSTISLPAQVYIWIAGSDLSHDSNGGTLQWYRASPAAPSNVMPSISAGSLQSTEGQATGTTLGVISWSYKS
jgi:hypothetical protein